MTGALQKKFDWKILLPIVIPVLIGIGLIIFDWARVREILQQADWQVIPAALLFVLGSNSLLSISYVSLARIIGIRMDGYQMGIIYFATNAMNRLVRSGGVAGFMTRYFMMKPSGVGLNDVLNSSFIHFLLSSLIMHVMVLPVVIVLLVTHPIPIGLFLFLVIFACLAVFTAFLIGSIIFSDPLRRRVARGGIWLGKKIIRRDFTGQIESFLSQANGATHSLKENQKDFSLVILMLVAEWLANVFVLFFCLRSFGTPLSFSGTAAIYSLATIASVISAIPGGIGIQEGVITSLAVVLGTSFEQAVLGALLFRVLQTFLPYLGSLVFYPRLLRKVNAAEVKPTDAGIDL